MSEYANLAKRIDDREVILLDGAIGTQLQRMGVPLSDQAWAGIALKDYPYTVRRMHENYIKAGVDIITTNTYPSARHNLDPLGLADMTHELNLRGVMLAEEARERCAVDRPVYIAGAVSNYGLIAGAEPGWRDIYFTGRAELSDRQARGNLREQAEILAEGGVDFMIAEATGSSQQRRWVIEACVSTGLPVWMGFKCRLEEGSDEPLVGYLTDEPLMKQFADIAALGGSVVSVFHSSVGAINAALPLVQEKWSGPISIYPEAERDDDYITTHRDTNAVAKLSPEDFVAQAKHWVDQGVQIVGGCCGVELEYIEPLRDALPTHLPG